ncbi:MULTISPECIES: 3-methyl-2-oxobutanoate hydroxymethyltransferase [Pyrobaculum]|uniref:3-methyl-2-oxobutanoate hydroxymethyltransferase n=4 Tax=Pyrobaculum TaxID=2276 RepID=PANB_PYRAR|nr:3-methyl-2-oxobutanoate hydroxymethyltransferase [Pyrobaculum arsenaticum]A4WMD4.1 RecName: Full=3-methyl-2-oxobutanoate hydroxymethyltransferase; AltName: Full=Ketopantoate hydroxymethyltransferase; Short=KPHMT [Pyrobaculum arsenaticum DSM 13514]ABP51551.1 ketopantoate hydroxymethyltransferase [Pyrobaculum arsenaticum DSM 13514]MCY0891029.1 3-methyl-2-oxobutanoate hydroxymethyltransferase [Pyrobaculum arsenaticum]NYR16480.1 3-methyl-2-oxobutanoate hydroxymethyltransferase [Pyrobaculum arsen
MPDKKRRVTDFVKGGGPYVWVTAYDYPTAKLVDEAGVDGILVGDSLGMVVLGLPNTLGVTLADMVRHTQAVARAAPKALVVADMPFMTYETGPRDALRNAARLIRAGAEAVKLEGGSEYAHVVEKLVKAGIPVMGHIGLNPQRVLALGGFKMVGKTEEQKKKLVEDAKALRDVGVFAIVVEFVPASVAKEVTQSVDVPTICIGAGPHCDGQILVLHDVVGLSERTPSFAKRYANVAEQILSAVRQYVQEVRTKAFPAKEHYRDV